MEKPNGDNSPTEAGGAVRTRNLSITADQQETAPVNLPDVPEQHEHQPESRGIISRTETLRVLLLSPHPHVLSMRALADDHSTSITLTRCLVTNINEYRDAITAGFFTHEILILHVLLVHNGQPFFFDEIIREDDLYSCIPQRGPDNQTLQITIFQFRFQHRLEQQLNLPQEPMAASVPGPRLNLDVLQFDVPNYINEERFYNDDGILNQFINMISVGTEGPTINRMVRYLLEAGLRCRLATGLPLPRTPLSVTTVPQTLDVPNSEVQRPIQGTLELPKSSECDKGILVAVGIFVTSYKLARIRMKCTLEDRSGCEHDYAYCRKVAEKLGCLGQNIYMLYPEGGVVKKQNVEYHFDKLKIYRNKSESISNLFLFISAHGRLSGFVTSEGQVLSLSEIVRKLKTYADHVTVFYQACRGDNEHRVDGPSPALDGFSFPFDQTTGSSLPWDQPGCSAIYASSPGCKAYSNKKSGGLMLQALSEAVKELGQRDLRDLENFRQLANKVQEKLHKLLRDRFGREVIKKTTENRDTIEFQVRGQIHSVMHLPL